SARSPATARARFLPSHRISPTGPSHGQASKPRGRSPRSGPSTGRTVPTVCERACSTRSPTRVRPEPGQLDRFTLAVEFEKEAARLEYAVLKQTDGGATVASRLPAATAADLKLDVERVVLSLSVTNKIAEK